MSFPEAGRVKPGQFFEVSIPKYGEAPISVSGIGEDYVDLTIRRVGRVTNKIFQHYVGNTLLMRGPYGNASILRILKEKKLWWWQEAPDFLLLRELWTILPGVGGSRQRHSYRRFQIPAGYPVQKRF